jgi:single-strand selective monofunctional uracil DNA glycosylase
MRPLSSFAELNKLQKISRDLSDKMSGLLFAEPVAYVYNPLDYAFATHCDFLQKYGGAKETILFLGMNPGPWGMLQTGVPFGQIDFVKNWLSVKGEIGKPLKEHPKRLVEGFDCTRREVSGERFWQWIKDGFDSPEEFFKRFFVSNYCPLGFLEAGGRNRIPEKLSDFEREELFAICDESLREVVKHIEARAVIGIGKFAEKRASVALDGMNIPVYNILHPSPASPVANRGWAAQATAKMKEIGIPWP